MVIFTYGMIFSSFSDYLLSKDCIKKTRLRCWMAMISLGLPGITVAVLGYTTHSWILCIAVLSIGIGFRSAIYMGHIGAVYEVAPTYSGTVYGFVSTIGNISGFITPLITAYFTKENPHDVTGWRNLFWMASGFYFVAASAFPLLVRQEPADFELQDTNGYQNVGSYGSFEDTACD